MKTYKKKIKTILQKSVICFVALSTILSMTSIPYLSPLKIKTAQATTPTILVVEQVNPSAVEVIFSEAMDAEDTAQNPNYYTFSGGLTVVDAVQQGPPNIYRIVANGSITAGVTTLTVSASVLALDGVTNNTTTSAQAIVNPVRVKISEVMTELNGATNKEFIELYNAGGQAIDLSGYKLHFRNDSGTDTNRTLDFSSNSASDTIPAYGFFLIASSQYTDIGTTPDATYTAESNDLADNGSVYLSTSETALTNVIDMVGFGDQPSNGYEGTAVANLSAGQSIERKAFGGSQAVDMAVGGMDATMGNGWDTNGNNFDFVIQSSPSPQNSSSTPEQQDFSSYGGAAGNGPMIMHMPVNSAITGSALEITAQMGDPMTPIDQIVAELHYMIGDGSPTAAEFTTILGVHQSNGFFKFTIPVDTVNASTGDNGLCYYLKVVTDGGTGFMSASATADTASVGEGMTYATVALKEAVVAVNPFIISVAAAGNTFAISGQVTNDLDEGINGVLVMIEGTGYSATTATDGATVGKYSILVPNGIYNLTMIRDGYFEEWINDVFVNGAAVTVDRTMYLGQGGGMTGDSEKPMVMWTGPPDGMMGIPSGMADFKIFVGFSKDIDSTTFTTSNVTLTNNPSGTAEAALTGYTVQYNPTRTGGMPPVEMDPYLGVIGLPSGGVGFTENTTYYLIMNNTIRDTAGNALQGNRPDGGHMISFTAGGTFTNDQMMGTGFGTGAMMPPFVIGTNPYDGAMNVMTNAKININFSDSMDSTTVNTTNIKLYKLTYSGYDETEIAVDFSISLDTSGKNATLTPTEVLAAGSRYRVAVSGALKSATGIWMGDPGQGHHVSTYRFYNSGFEVGSTSDDVPPTVLGSWPANEDIDIAVNPGMMTIQFSEGMDPSTINSNTITLKRGTSSVTGNISYDPMSQSASFSPSVILATSTDYTLTVTTSVTDAVGVPIASNIITFTTDSVSDAVDPSIMFANGDEYGVAITFSESMNSASVADTAANYATSVLNPLNYIIKQGPAGTTNWSGISGLVLTNAKFKYDGMGNTVMIDNISGATAGNDYYIDTTSTTVAGAGVTDLSGNDMTSDSTFQMPIQSSANTGGMLGPMMGGGGMMGPDMGMMGMMGAGVFPMNAMAGQTTIYFVDVPTTKAIPAGGRIVLTFPVGFDVENAAKDPYSPVNNDINEWNAGTVEILSVLGDKNARTITITTKTSATQPNDFLCMDIKDIVNSSIPRGFETSGYTVDMKTMDVGGNLLETITAMPFFINEGGSNSLVVTINGVTATDGGNVTVFLGSPMTGPMEQTANFNGVDETSETVTFSNLLEGQYMLFTEPTITLGTTDYLGMPMPQPIIVDQVGETKTMALAKEDAGAVAAVTVNITGIPNGDEIDVFAGSPVGFKVKTLTGTGSALSTILYLPAGDWMVGVGPAMPKGPMAGPPPMPNWMPPMPTTIVSNGSSSQTLDISISTATMEIVGYVQDEVGNAIADAEAFAYQPMGMGMGSHAKTDTNGKFTLKVATAGTYSVGVFKPGLPGTPDRTVRVFTDGDLENVGSNPVDDGNSTADVEVDNSLIIDVNNNGTEDAGDNLFIFKIQKPDWTISGKVTNGTNPVSYAPVWAYQPNGMGHADTMTDASGNYILYVSNGNWIVQSYIPGFGDSQSQTVVVDGASMTQNLSQDSSVTYYAISGTVTLDAVQTYMPIRAVEYDSNGNYLGREYGGQTDASGEYSISVPGSASGKYYRVDIWTPEFGEVELTVTDEVANNPANVIITTADKTGKDITITSGNLKTVDIKFTNGTASQTGIVNIDGLSCSGDICHPTGFHKTIKMSALNADSSVRLPVGDYLFFLDVPGAGFYIPDEADAAGNTKHCITVVGGTPATWVEGTVSLTDNTVEFDLPDSSTELFAVTGTITDSSDSSNIEGAWVWMGNPTTGVHTGAVTNSSGVYTITVKTGTYKMGVEMPGYVPQQPTNIVVSADASEVDYVLTAADQFITGVIYADADNDSTYDSNEEIANGWVWVEETTTKQIAGSPTEVDGTFSVGVVDGTYILKGVGEGYSETGFGSPITVSGSDSAGNNINLTVDANWSAKLKSRPMTPASGGTLDDSLSSGTGVKIVAPPNALGSGTSSGNIRTKEVSSVSKTNSAEPLGGKGKEITAQDNSGQAITTLNSDIEIELNYYKEDITEAGETSMGKLKLLTNSYWDASVGDWVPLSTTKKAYTKVVGAVASAEWTAQPNFDTFVDDLISDADAYGDYKITLQSTTGHLTIFGGTTPSDLIAPSAPTNLSATAGNNQVVLDWDDNSEADLLEYEIYRSTSESVQAISANQVNTSQVAVSQYTDTTAQNGITYYYVVTAADSSGNESSVSNEIAAMPISAGSGGTNPSASASVTAPVTATGTVEATVSAGGETTLTAAGNTTAKVEIPANALTQNATVEIVSASTATVAASAPVPTGKSMASAFEITATAGTTSVSSFSKAVTLSFTYTDEQISGIDEATLKIYRWNGTEWIVLSSTVNAATNTITAKTTNFSNFAIMGDLTGTETGTVELSDGDVARIGAAAEVYIIKIVNGNKYKRHIVSPEVFNSYGHLDWDAIKSVSNLDDYSLSAWVRNCTGANGTPAATDKVYEVNGDSTMHHLNMTAAQFYARGGSEEAIYNVNQAELNLYSLGVDVMYQ